MNKQDFLEICLGLIIGFAVYLAVSFTLWELNITDWHWIGRGVWLSLTAWVYMHIEIEWEYIEEEEE